MTDQVSYDACWEHSFMSHKMQIGTDLYGLSIEVKHTIVIDNKSALVADNTPYM